MDCQAGSRFNKKCTQSADASRATQAAREDAFPESPSVSSRRPRRLLIADANTLFFVLVRSGSTLMREGSADYHCTLTERSLEQLTVRPGETQRSMPRIGVMTIEFREAVLDRMWKFMIPWRRWRLGIGLALGGVILMQAPGNAGVLDASWTAPTTNIDTSGLTDLASYRVYYGVTSSPCGGPSFLQLAAPTTTPSPRRDGERSASRARHRHSLLRRGERRKHSGP